MVNKALETTSKKSFPAICRDCDHVFKTNILQSVLHCPSCRGLRIIAHLELLTLSIAHLDCDAFFAAIEKRDDPSLADKPLIIGGGKRGVVSTCCYIARTYGIHSAMPMFKALKRCPHAVVRPAKGPAIREAAHAIREEMRALTPLVQPLSVDEAFMDLSGTEKLHKAVPAASLAKLIRRIETRVGITASIGLSHNKFLAKIASDLDKPQGFAVIGAAETLSFLADKPINFIYGVGKSFTAKLARDGFNTIGDLQQADPHDLAARYGEHGIRLAKLSRGEDFRPVNPNRETKSISAETTFQEDLRDYDALEDKLWGLCEKVSRRMKEKDFVGRVVTLKLKTSAFKSFTRRKTLDHHSNLAQILFETGQHLLREVCPRAHAPDAYRLIGIGFSDLEDANTTAQNFLFMDNHNRLEAKEKAIDSLRSKFGDNAIGTGRNLGKNGLRHIKSEKLT